MLLKCDKRVAKQNHRGRLEFIVPLVRRLVDPLVIA